jgi:SsrA-binding protein
MKQDQQKIICRNRKAYFDYHLDDIYEAGLVLLGTEVKSLRQGRANIDAAFARFKDGELYLLHARISPYDHAGPETHDQERPRKLLLTKRELKRLQGKVQEQGYTLVPLKLFFKHNKYAKVEIALARGKKKADKRETIRRREQDREMQRARKRR